jgi:hypothetical protein
MKTSPRFAAYSSAPQPFIDEGTDLDILNKWGVGGGVIDTSAANHSQ